MKYIVIMPVIVTSILSFPLFSMDNEKQYYFVNVRPSPQLVNLLNERTSDEIRTDVARRSGNNLIFQGPKGTMISLSQESEEKNMEELNNNLFMSMPQKEEPNKNKRARIIKSYNVIGGALVSSKKFGYFGENWLSDGGSKRQRLSEGTASKEEVGVAYSLLSLSNQQQPSYTGNLGNNSLEKMKIKSLLN